MHCTVHSITQTVAKWGRLVKTLKRNIYKDVDATILLQTIF